MPTSADAENEPAGEYAVAVANANLKANAMVAQACAFAVMDAVDGLRNLETIGTTAVGVALAQFLATKDPTYLEAVKTVQSVLAGAVSDFSSIGSTAGQVLRGFAGVTPGDPPTSNVANKSR